MYLKEILDTKKKIKFKRIILNSQEIEENDLFIPFSGCEDRSKYIPDALLKKCSLVITDKDYPNKKVLKINNLNQKIITIFNKYYHYPLKNLHLIGITGTDGKTTICHILSHFLNCPSLGTLGFKINNRIYNLNNTTPSLDKIYEAINDTKTLGFKDLVMEVSSEAYLTNRIGNLPFDIAIFSNLTKDHLDKHKDFNNYLNCKLKLFQNSKFSILNRDSKYYELFKLNSQSSLSYGFSKKADLRIIYYKLYQDKTFLIIKYQRKFYKIISPLLGKFNVYNLVSCLLTCFYLGYDFNYLKTKILSLQPVPGRMEILSLNPFVVLDYAHTTNSTLKVLKYFHKFQKNIITIVGSAGDRYQEKRKEIGKIVLKYSKLVIFTTDDPRYEDPNLIISNMLSKTKKKNYVKILNREEAIKYAITNYPKSLILVLGKGRDNYMLIKNQKIPYSDYETILEILKK